MRYPATRFAGSTGRDRSMASRCPAIARKKAWIRIRAPRLMSRSSSTSTTGAGREFPSMCAPASGWLTSRWAGVPFYVRAGKRLANQLTEIAVHFKRTPQALFSRSPKDVHHNVITMRIQPNEGISVSFGAKQPGPQMRAIRVDMDFSYRDAFGGETPTAYETLLLDAMRGDATLFTRRDEVEAEWRIITPIEEAWAE